MDNTIITPAEGGTLVETAVAPVVEEISEATKTVAEIIEEAAPRQEMVGLDKFLELKKENKQLKRSMTNLEDRIKSGESNISDDIDAIAEQHDVDRNFLQQLSDSIRMQTEKKLDEKYSSRIDAQERERRIEDSFDKHYKLAIEKAPEFDVLANKEIIKSLSNLPRNANKTISAILEDTYGNALTGKRSIETVKSGGGKDPENLDTRKASTDTAYFLEVMANPKLKAEYNAQMLKKGF